MDCQQAMGDVCVDSTSAVQNIVANQYGSAIADYYIHCPADVVNGRRNGPLNTLVLQSQLNVDESVRLVAQFAALTEMNYSPKDVR